MKDKIVKEAQGLVKNPIGVIGLFLVLVEAIAAFVIIQSSLDYSLNLILVLFIVIFPFVVLLAFYLLVTKHHEKLYSPSDYKDEMNFVSTYNSATRTEEIVKVNCQNEIETSHTKEGMTIDDINLIKESLNSVVAMQKHIVKKIESEETVAIVENVEKNINERLDSYVMEKQYNYKTDISYIYGSREFVKKLHQKGYEAEIYFGIDGRQTLLKKNSEHEAIWLGRSVPLDLAIDVIKMAKNKFPHLKYIELSGKGAPEYVHYEIYIGGATSTAIENRLKKLSTSDFEEMYKCESIEALHEYIINFNS